MGSTLKRPLDLLNRPSQQNEEKKPILPTSLMLDHTPLEIEDDFIGEDEEDEGEYDDIDLEKAQNLMYGGAGEYIYRRSKDPDNPD